MNDRESIFEDSRLPLGSEGRVLVSKFSNLNNKGLENMPVSGKVNEIFIPISLKIDILYYSTALSYRNTNLSTNEIRFSFMFIIKAGPNSR